MKKRRSVSKGKAKRTFKRGTGINPKNSAYNTRGGIRL